MVYVTQKIKKIVKRRWVWLVAAIILLVAIIVLALEMFNVTSFVGNDSSTAEPNQAQQSTQGSSTNSINHGGATDTMGDTSSAPVTDSANWKTSATGMITLQWPTEGSTVKSGDTFYGTASVEKIEFRVTDDRVGVIAQGELSVVNGKFSGILNFQPHGSAGTLEIFSLDNTTGNEINHAIISVNYDL